ncbi:MAG TPA: nucleotidyltransferase domain-containing protein [Phycisphaerales bacterium]|nr:nucleotidyltransferase domain-containing protein [Phycisphaerales bacterium]
MADRTEDVESIVRRAAEALVAAGAREVYVFGSCARGDESQGSDLDLAVSGIPPSRYFAAAGAAQEAASGTGRMVDVIDLDVRTPLTEYLRVSGSLCRVA